MTRRKLSRELKREAVRLVTERGVSIAQAAHDLDLHQTVLGRWVRDDGQNAQGALPGHGKLRAQAEESRRLR